MVLFEQTANIRELLTEVEHILEASSLVRWQFRMSIYQLIVRIWVLNFVR